MERTLSDEEKIKRAIEISQRRNRVNIERIAKVPVDNKKNYKLFKRMILQIIICLLIYFIFYLISTTNYVFSENVINQTNQILNYDINLYEWYQKALNEIKLFINKESENDTKEEINSVYNAIINNVEEQNKSVVVNDNIAKVEMSQMEKDVITIKENYEMQKPLSGKVTSEFGERETTSEIMTADHKGIDIAANMGTEIKAAMSGQVEEASNNSKYGNYIKIKNNELLTVYAHCEKLKVSKGDKVQKGDVIATVGSTGNSTGPHLHFEIRLSDRYINPRFIIKF